MRHADNGVAVIMDNTNKKRKMSALDTFAVMLIFLCAAGVAIRAYIGNDGALPEIGKKSEDYTVSFEINGITSAVSSYITQGESVYFENGELLGTVGVGLAVTPAMTFIEDTNGKYIQFYASADNGDASLVDVRGTITVSGYKTDYGFLANGKTYLAPNFETVLHTKNVTVTVKITDITAIGN